MINKGRVEKIVLFFIVVLATVFFAGGIGNAADCDMCHPELKQKKAVHTALNMGCETCHTGIDASEVPTVGGTEPPHKKTNTIAKGLSAETPELCYSCHDKTMFTRKNVHAALQMGCGACHNPHSSENAKQLLSPLPDLCLGCHDKTKFENKTVHAPVAGGMCTGCHDPHSSRNSGLLVTALPDLCFSCHDKKMFSGKKAVHAPVAGGMCISCHKPHASSEAKLLTIAVPALCYGCHDKAGIEGGGIVHSPVAGGMCLSCHTSHQGDNAKLLLSDVPELCFTCHDKADFNRKNQHSPVAVGMCMSCHRPHTSENNALLPKFAIDVCLECHADVAKNPHAISGFSGGGHPLDGKTYKDKAGRKQDLSCPSCHNPHSSESKKLFQFQADKPFDICKNCHDF
jgi:predicted CXXCH cytochrome family protein